MRQRDNKHDFIKNTIKALAQSQVFYSRIWRALQDAEKNDKPRAAAFYKALKNANVETEQDLIGFFEQ